MLFNQIFVCFVSIEIVQLIQVPTSWTNLQHGTYTVAKSKPLPASTSLKSYVQVRRGVRKSRVPKLNRNLNRAVQDSKIYTVFIEDGFYNRDFDHGLQEEHKRGYENVKRFKRFGNENKQQCVVNDNEIIQENLILKRAKKTIKNRVKHSRPQIRNLESMIDCLKNRNFGKTPPLLSDEIPKKSNIDEKLEIIDNHFNKLLEKYNNKKGNLRSKRSTKTLPFKKKHGVLSEVYYKDEMNRNQQNAIFEDVRKHFNNVNKIKTNQTLRLKKYLETILEEIQTKITSKKPNNNLVIRKMRLQRNEIEGLQPPILSLTTFKPKKNRVKRFKKNSFRVLGKSRKLFF